MKVQFRSILFALVLPAAACGGDREASTVSTQSAPVSSVTPAETPAPAPSVAPSSEQPKVVEVKAPLPTKYDEALAMGRELLAKGEYGDAKEMLESAAKLDGKKAEPHIELARMYIATDQKGKAIAAAKQALKRAPNSSVAWNTKGRAELAAHNYDNAIAAFSTAIENNRDNVFAWNNLGYTELLLEKFDDAAEHLSEATSRKGATGYMFNNLGTALEHLDRLDEARTAFEAGGKLGSVAAAASRKRLEGVTSIAIASSDVPSKQEPASYEYELTDEDNAIDEAAAEQPAAEPAVTDESVDASDDAAESSDESIDEAAPVDGADVVPTDGESL